MAQEILPRSREPIMLRDTVLPLQFRVVRSNQENDEPDHY